MTLLFKICIFLTKERTKKKFESFLDFLNLDNVIMIITDDQFVCFCNERKNMGTYKDINNG